MGLESSLSGSGRPESHQVSGGQAARFNKSPAASSKLLLKGVTLVSFQVVYIFRLLLKGLPH